MFKLINNSLKNLKHNKGRTILTLLGVVIGIFSVVTLLNLGKAAQRYIEDQISTFGSDLLNIVAGSSTVSLFTPVNRNNPNSYFTDFEIDKLQKLDKKYILAIVEELNSSASLKYKSNLLATTAIRAADENYFLVRGYNLLYGRAISEEDNLTSKKVIILDKSISEKLFGENTNPVGENVLLNGTSYKVIGVKTTAQSIIPIQENYIPINTLRRYLEPTKTVSSLSLKAINSSDVNNAKFEAENLMRKVRNLKENDENNFIVNSSQDALTIFNNVTNILTLFLAAIGGISLLVGGIGIMNIMLVTVKERTKEIGLRKAIGANSKDIFSQFLTESITVTLLGGIIGLLLGIAVFYLVSKFANLSFELDPVSVILPIVVSSLIGIVFGIYPSMKASKMSPIEELRYE